MWQTIVRGVVGFGMALCVAAHARAEETGVDEPTTPPPTVAAYRAVVADYRAPRAWIVDLEAGSVLSTVALHGHARLHRGSSGRYAFAVQSESGRVNAIDTGIAREDHGDHSDIALSPPLLLRAELAGSKPVHFNRGDRDIAIFFDGDGTAAVLAEADFVRGAHAGLQRIPTAAAHHGVAVPIGRHVAISVPTPGQVLPDAIELKAPSGESSERIACPRLHGESTSGRFIAFGCADGLAVFDVRGATASSRKISYSADLSDGRLIRTLEGARGYALFFADFGPRTMLIVDPSQSGAFTFVDLPGRRMAFTLLEDPGDTGFVLIEDGHLLRVNTLTGDVTHRAAVTPRYAMTSNTARPRVSAVGPWVVVTHPDAGEIIVLDADTLVERRRLKIDGVPFDVVAVGGEGTRH